MKMPCPLVNMPMCIMKAQRPNSTFWPSVEGETTVDVVLRLLIVMLTKEVHTGCLFDQNHHQASISKLTCGHVRLGSCQSLHPPNFCTEILSKIWVNSCLSEWKSEFYRANLRQIWKFKYGCSGKLLQCTTNFGVLHQEYHFQRVDKKFWFLY